ncbi:hypothetical protein GRF29_106g1215993 [Pseudopithomyces chartarum]|uniref:Uncharacterized protein n=1 Tax=Pseudopithomyces chartarum TaxID=1892770 RepID=A0AAN6LVH1_9PLEO|nr:hypothetical protein GRF29_106g1215993 [Pseudopithomyces chartarum]
MHFETSPGSSPSKSIPIAFKSSMSSPTDSLYSNCSVESSTSSRGLSCAYPSWPTGSSLEYRSTPSSYISDADLFGDDLDDEFSSPYLQEAPAPPRQPPMAQAFPILPPLYATEKPKKQQQQRRRSSGRKSRRSSKPMTPISESPEAHRD